MSKTGKKIGVIAHGSRGDVQPLVAIAVNFQKMGYGVVLYAGPENDDFAKTYSFEFVPLKSTKALYDDKAWLKKLSSLNPDETNEAMCDVLKHSLGPDAQQIKTSLESDSSICCLIGSTNAISLLAACNYSRNIPGVNIFFQPHYPTTAHLSPMFNSKDWAFEHLHPSVYPALQEAFLHGYVTALYDSINAPWELMMGSKDKVGHMYDTYDGVDVVKCIKNQHPTLFTVFGASEVLLGGRPSDMNKETVLAGYPTLENTEDSNNKLVGVSNELRTFMKAGDPPAYIGFGSMCALDNKKIITLAVGALHKTGKRGVILAGWADLAPNMLDDSPELKKYAESGNILFQKSLPHDWLFPQCCCVVHHGGAGTTHSAMLGGSPSIIIPFYFDQNFFADRTVMLGMGQRLPSMVEVTVDDLSAAITTATTDSAMISAAKKVRERLKDENGALKAAEAIVDYISRYDPEKAKEHQIMGAAKARRSGPINVIKNFVVEKYKSTMLTFNVLYYYKKNNLFGK
mmetsp:Transcript_9452/g.10954  ORF Transcript_9452/g.10954 Transcript_9452/m.10954 type:complete len:514 (+) Transcript_9452:99-1640(+)